LHQELARFDVIALLNVHIANHRRDRAVELVILDGLDQAVGGNCAEKLAAGGRRSVYRHAIAGHAASYEEDNYQQDCRPDP
jgi:hypothetical protein